VAPHNGSNGAFLPVDAGGMMGRAAVGRPAWQSIWQSGRCHPGGRDTIDWTHDPT
jgi:hypothetical protein